MLVSVVIPVYNDGKYLVEAIESIRSQTYKDIEIVVVNDGSTDTDTLHLLDKLSHEGLQVLHKENGHLSSARNYGITHASGELILTLDADDKFHSTFVSKAVKVIAEDEAIGVVTCYVQSFGDQNYKWKPKGGGLENFLWNNEACGNSLFRKSIWSQIGGFDVNMKKGYEDWEFWIRITAAGWKVAVIKEYLFYYRISSKSMLLNTSIPNRKEILHYIVNKHPDIYHHQLAEMLQEWKLVDLRQPLKWRLIGKLLFKKLVGR
jgi:glycosyltransferase involved in cell wall biosynthesis